MDSSASLLTRGVTEVVVLEHLKKALESGKTLRVKFGIDPTGNLLHLGHAIPLLKLREFQDAGHTVILLIGDFTATIGDPTGKNKTRTILSEEQIKENMATYLDQAALVLDISKVEVRYNTEWYGKMSMVEMMQLSSNATMAQIKQRAEFKQRIEKGEDITMLEFFYPILQGYDSVALHADVELGGTDQKFNLLMGRQIQERYEQEPQDVIMTPLLEGLDGHEKMSKSLDNYIALTDAPEDMYGKIMSVPDTLLEKYFTLTTLIPLDEITEIMKGIAAGNNPRDAKMMLARDIVTRYHDQAAAEKAEANFISVFQKGEVPAERETIQLDTKDWNIVDILVSTGFCKSKTEARTIIEQHGVRINGKEVLSPDEVFTIGTEKILIQKGKKSFADLEGK